MDEFGKSPNAGDFIEWRGAMRVGELPSAEGSSHI